MNHQPVYIIDGARTPFLKARNAPGPFSAGDLATAAGRALLVRQPFAAEQLDEVILGCASPSPDEVNIGRVAALRMGCGLKVPGWTVMRNCASGMQALDSAIANINSGRSQLVLAGGVDALSHAPLLYSKTMVLWFAKMAQAKTAGQKAALFAKLKPGALLSPVIGIMKGLTDPVVNLLMGQTAENLAHRFGITREQMDAFSVRSHQRVAAGQDAGHYGEVVPLVGRDGKVYAADDGVRRDSSMAGLAHVDLRFQEMPAATAISGARDMSRNSLSSPFEAALNQYFGGRAAVDRFTDGALELADQTVARAHALRRLGEHFPPEAVAAFSAADRVEFQNLYAEHATALGQSVRQLDQLATPVLTALQAPPVAAPRTAATPAELLETARSVEQMFAAVITGSPANAISPDLPARLRVSLTQLNNLADILAASPPQ